MRHVPLAFWLNLDGGLRFRHPLIRAALYDEMPASARAAWHRDAGRAFAAAGVSADRVARQMLRAVSGSPGRSAPWMTGCWNGWPVPRIRWSARRPGSRSTCLPGRSPAPRLSSARHGLLASRLADALYRTGDRTQAERVANHELEHVAEPDLLVDLHWTLAQCRMRRRLGRGIPDNAGSGPGCPRDLSPAPRPAARTWSRGRTQPWPASRRPARSPPARWPQRHRQTTPGRWAGRCTCRSLVIGSAGRMCRRAFVVRPGAGGD